MQLFESSPEEDYRCPQVPQGPPLAESGSLEQAGWLPVGS